MVGVMQPRLFVQEGASHFEGIQALRFIAALLVVCTHATLHLSERLLPGYPLWNPGASGVDVFFVISGFVMVASSRDLIERPDGATVFLTRRLIRIVPLYWAATSLKVLLIVSMPQVATNAVLDPLHLVSSYLFIPARNAAGEVFPVLGVGWTLNYEMFFYLVFALALAWRMDPLRFVTVLFVGAALLAPLRDTDWPALTVFLDPILLEFVAGMLIATGILSWRWRLPLPAACVLAVVGLLGLVWPWEGVDPIERIVFWGIPAMLVVAGVAFAEPALKHRVPRVLLSLGDSSYALYLFHPMISPIVPTLLAKAGLPLAAVSIGGSVALSVALTAIVYRIAERPVTRTLRSRAEGRWRRAWA